MADGPPRALVRAVARSYVAYYARKGRTVSASLADAQHAQYRRALETAGLTVTVVPPDETFPDGVFIEDTAVVWGQYALIARMCPEREGEQAAVAEVLRPTHTIRRLIAGATLDGGDVLHLDDSTYVGLSTRTNEAGAEAVRELLVPFGRRVVTVPVANCLHLKTGVTYLGNRTLLAVPGWFELRRFHAEEVIHTGEGEQGSANTLRIGNHLLVPAGYPETARRLQRFAEQHGLHVQTLDISEFEKGDGSLTCLSIILGEPGASATGASGR
jgi:dimethylargininase